MKTFDKNDLLRAWKRRFDSIYLINYIFYENRKERMYKVLRSNMLENDTTWIHPVPSGFDDKLIEYNNDIAGGMTKPKVNLALAHYRAISEAYWSGKNSILIMEDDIAFLKDKELLSKIIMAIPYNSDIILLDKSGLASQKKEYEMEISHPLNEYFASMGCLTLWNASCYCLSRRGMRYIIDSQEKCLNVADYYTNLFPPERLNTWKKEYNGINVSFAITNAAIQIPSSEDTVTNHRNRDNWVYMQPGLWDCGMKPELYETDI